MINSLHFALNHRIESLGFATSSLRRESEAVTAIEAMGSSGQFKLVHDTFHHLSAETDYFVEHTGIVHISGVIETKPSRVTMADKHRILINEYDRLGNVEQTSPLPQLGYSPYFSFESFSPPVYQSTDPTGELSYSMANIHVALTECLSGVRCSA